MRASRLPSLIALCSITTRIPPVY